MRWCQKQRRRRARSARVVARKGAKTGAESYPAVADKRRRLSRRSLSDTVATYLTKTPVYQMAASRIAYHVSELLYLRHFGGEPILEANTFSPHLRLASSFCCICRILFGQFDIRYEGPRRVRVSEVSESALVRNLRLRTCIWACESCYVTEGNSLIKGGSVSRCRFGFGFKTVYGSDK
jgi:hypothetical protein